MRVTEGSIRTIIRRILLEQAGADVTISVKNTGATSMDVIGIYSSADVDADGPVSGAKNMMPGTPVRMKGGQAADITYTPDAAVTEYAVVSVTPGPSGATKGYERDTNFSTAIFASGATSVDLAPPARGTAAAGEEGDQDEMDQAAMDALPREAGEHMKVVEDPTDPEFSYAVFYKWVPTRAVVVKAPVEDRRGGRAVSSRGKEISMRRFSGSFQKVAAELIRMSEEEAPEVMEAPPTPPAGTAGP